MVRASFLIGTAALSLGGCIGCSDTKQFEQEGVPFTFEYPKDYEKADSGTSGTSILSSQQILLAKDGDPTKSAIYVQPSSYPVALRTHSVARAIAALEREAGRAGSVVVGSTATINGNQTASLETRVRASEPPGATATGATGVTGSTGSTGSSGPSGPTSATIGGVTIHGARWTVIDNGQVQFAVRCSWPKASDRESSLSACSEAIESFEIKPGSPRHAPNPSPTPGLVTPGELPYTFDRPSGMTESSIESEDGTFYTDLQSGTAGNSIVIKSRRAPATQQRKGRAFDRVLRARFAPGRVVAVRSVQVAGHDARQFDAANRAKPGATSRSTYFVADESIYSIDCLSAGRSRTKFWRKCNQVLDSFRLQ